MPIIFEDRLGNSASDRKLRSIYRVHHILWTLYYTIFFAVLGFGIALYVAVEGSPVFASIIAIVTVVVLVLFFRRQVYRRRRK